MKSMDWAIDYSLAGYTFGRFVQKKNSKNVEKSQSQSYF